MGEAVDKPPAPSTPEVAAAAAVPAPGLEAVFVDDFLLFMDEPSVSNGNAKQGKKEEVEAQEEEEEELEWLSNLDAFPPLDTSLTFGPTTVSNASVSLEALEAVVKELGSEEVEEWETEKVRVPTKRRSQVLRRPRQVFSNLPVKLAGESKNVKQPSVRRCTHCLVDDTPQWRQGPAGPGTLCNACGVRYKSGRLYDEYRPVNSPTFSPGKHSNFHRKVLEMRGGKQTDKGVILSTNGGRRSRLGGNEPGGEMHDSGGLGT